MGSSIWEAPIYDSRSYIQGKAFERNKLVFKTFMQFRI
jgi:hypothetical protein